MAVTKGREAKRGSGARGSAVRRRPRARRPAGRPLAILVTNDDGVYAPGLRALAKALRPLGGVTIVAPDRERSAASHALTLHQPLRIREIEPRVHAVDGTPTDCVLLAYHGILRRRIDLVVSGVNHGPNMGDDVSYSGTVAAAIEGTTLGIPSIAVSLSAWKKVGFDAAARFAASLSRAVLEKGLRPQVLLNVNIPPRTRSRIRGVKVTRLGKRVYRDVIIRKLDPRGRPYYWIGGEEPTWESAENTDFTAVEEGFVSITPLHLDLTDYKSIVDMEAWDLGL
jgi:5'-nucleotidase